MVQSNGTKGDNAMPTNPYASPQTDCSQANVASEEVVRREMRTAIRLYWWMGAVSLLYSTIGVVSGIGWVLNGAPMSAEAIAGIIFLAMILVAATSSIHLANRLKTSPQGVLPRARLVGIIMATWWFPWLTVPGIICVRRVTRQHASWCEIVAEANGRTNS